MGQFDPAGIAISPNGSTAYVAVPGADQVVPINLATNTTGSPIQLEIAPVAVAISPDGTTAYAVTAANDDSVTPINLATGTPQGSPYPTWGTPPTPSPSPPTAPPPTWSTTETATVNATVWPPSPVGVGPYPVGSSPDAIAITPNGTTAYVTNNGGRLRLDLRSTWPPTPWGTPYLN